MDLILSIDPGTTSGWAILTVEAAPKLLTYGAIHFPKPRRGQFKTATEAIEEATKRAKGSIIQTVIEDQFVSKNMQSALKLARKAGRWEEASEHLGFPVEYVAASSWQSKELSGFKRKDLKKGAKAKVKGIWNEDVSEHIADAALLGRWFALRMFYKNPSLFQNK